MLSSSHYCLKRMLITCCKMLDSLLEPYARDDIFAEPDGDITWFVELSSMSHNVYADKLGLNNSSFHTCTKNIFSRETLWRDYHSVLATVRGHAVVFTNLSCCRGSRITSRCERACPQRQARETILTNIRTIATNGVVVSANGAEE